MLLNVCLLVIRLLFFEKFARAPYGQKQGWINSTWGPGLI